MWAPGCAGRMGRTAGVGGQAGLMAVWQGVDDGLHARGGGVSQGAPGMRESVECPEVGSTRLPMDGTTRVRVQYLCK